MATWAWCNGTLVDAKQLPHAAQDRGAILGLALFETLLVENGVPRFLTRHIERHRAACQRWGWKAPTKEQIDSALHELLAAEAFDAPLLRLRWWQTAGSGLLHDLSQGDDAQLIVTLAPYTPPPRTLRAILSPWQRNELSPLAGLKCASYAENCVALAHAHRHGAQEVIFLNRLEQVCEAATANVFLLMGNTLHTPDLAGGCLPGVARAQLLHGARENSIPVYERKILLEELFRADAVLLTSSLAGLRRVTQLDDHLFPEPTTPLWEHLQREEWLDG